MDQEKKWDREYRSKKLVTGNNIPQADFVRAIKDLKKIGFVIEDSYALDLGCGTGKNSFYLAERGSHVVGIDISKEALYLANTYKAETSQSEGVSDTNPLFKHGSIGARLSVDSHSIDLIIDITSSNSLVKSERDILLEEMNRALKPSGFIVIRGLLKDGDQNVKYLLEHNKGPEDDTYILPEVGIVEHVWSKEKFMAHHSKYFELIDWKKVEHYTTMATSKDIRKFKRNFFVAILKKK